MSISVLTIVKNRPEHLAQLIEGLKRNTEPPHELIIADMGSDPQVVTSGASFPIHVVRVDGPGLPLAAARNSAARAATGEHFLFLDVDCIPMRDLVGEMGSHLQHSDSLTCAEVYYLEAVDARGSWSEEALKLTAKAHPVRTFPASGVREEPNAGLFWSLAFGIRRTRFADLGGFDEGFTGYGAEDTDFGYRARQAGVPLMFMGGPGAFHQYHDVLDPPLHHLQDIVRNAQLFYDRWQIWPMEGWLRACSDIGVIEWSERKVRLLRRPDALELERARRSSPF